MDERHVAAFRGKFRPGAKRIRARLHRGEYVMKPTITVDARRYIDAMNRAARRTSEDKGDG